MSLRSRLSATYASLPPVFWTVWLGTLINRSGGFVVPLLTFYLTDERALALDTAGAIVSLFGAGSVLGALVGGVLADRFGRRFTMLLSLFGGATAMLLLGLAREPLAIAVLVFGLGFLGEMYRPAVAALIADVVPPADRMRAFGLLYWVINVGFSIAPVLAGTLAGVSYLALFIGDAATMALYGVLVALRVPDTRPPEAIAAARSRGTPSVRIADVLRDRRFMIFVALSFCTAMVPFQSTVSLSGYMRSQGHSTAVFGAVIAVNGVLIVLLQPLILRRLGAVDPSRLLAVSALLMGLGFFTHGLATAIAWHVVAVAIWTLGEIVGSPTNSVVVSAVAPPAARGRYQGLVTMSYGLASFGAPLLGSAVLASQGPDVLWIGCLVVGAAVAVALMAAAPGLRRRMARAETPATPATPATPVVAVPP